MYRHAIAITGMAIALGILILEPFEASINKGMFVFIVAATLWMTEVIHLTATALLVPVLAVLLGIFSMEESLRKFSHPIIFIFLGGFSLAAALQKTGLDRSIATKIIALARGRPRGAVFLLFLVTALLSMWVSNTAVTAMLLPLALGLIAALPREHRGTSLFILLGMAYSASIGGMGTLVGSPPNAIVGAALQLNFTDWMKVGLPVVCVLLPLLLVVLYRVLQPEFQSGDTIEIRQAPVPPGSRKVVVIFLGTVILWLLSGPLGNALGIEKYFDAWVAVAAIVALLLSKSLEWKDIEKTADWGVLLLFGGGLALGAVLQATGASAFIANSLAAQLEGVSFYVFLSLLVCFVIFLTELTSNTATAALLVPLFMTIAQTMGFSSAEVAMGIGLAASCAFMLPVATPPNAVVYGSGKVRQQEMMRSGFWLNLVAVAAMPALLYILL
ncbi:MAG: SLC13 family permease [Ketobacteraceae bacterium]|nr:SLC13 family permease [Ketobacteraceae bacterium]